jgi:hypothetical protein
LSPESPKNLDGVVSFQYIDCSSSLRGLERRHRKMLESALIVAGLVLIGWLFPEA